MNFSRFNECGTQNPHSLVSSCRRIDRGDFCVLGCVDAIDSSFHSEILNLRLHFIRSVGAVFCVVTSSTNKMQSGKIMVQHKQRRLDHEYSIHPIRGLLHPGSEATGRNTAHRQMGAECTGSICKNTIPFSLIIWFCPAISGHTLPT